MKMKLIISPCVVLFLLTACKPSAPLVPVGEACTEQSVAKRISVEGYLLIQRCLGEDVVWCDMYVEDNSEGLLKVQYSSDPDVILNPLAAPPRGDGWISSQVCGSDEDCYTGHGNTQFHLEGSCILNQQILMGSLPEMVAKRCNRPVIIVKRYRAVKELLEKVLEE